MNTHDKIVLPPLPEWADTTLQGEDRDSLFAWAEAAIEADRKRRGEPVKLCDCERGHNGMGMAGRECDCPGNNPQPIE